METMSDVSRSNYTRNGFVVIPGVLSPAELDQAREEAIAICRGDRGEIDGLSYADPLRTDTEVLHRYQCIHFTHKVSPLMRALGQAPCVVDALTKIIGPNVKMMQSMLFIKAEGKPGQAWHQDEAHIPTRDRSLTAAWTALDDATVDNGCLWVIPGSHRPGVLYPVRDQHDARFDCAQEAHSFGSNGQDAVPVELAAGSTLLFNGYLVHRSLPNYRPGSVRRSLVNHYMSAESLLPWFGTSRPGRIAELDHRDVELVAGADPHAAKGVIDFMRPQVRPTGQSICAG